MKYLKESKILIIVPLIMIMSCTHFQAVFPANNWDNRQINLKHFSVNIPESPEWFVIEVFDEEQRIILGSPDLLNTKAKEISVEGNSKKSLLLEKTGGTSHPGYSGFMKSTIDLTCQLVKAKFDTISDEDFLYRFIEEDLDWSFINGVINENTAYELKKVSPDSTQQFYGYLTNTGFKKFSTQFSIFSIYHKQDNRYLISAKLFAKRPNTNDHSYFGKLISSIKMSE